MLLPEKYYLDKLYPLMDKVLEIIFSDSTNFYLTGGTALSRYYVHHRYSDDLDFFQNKSPTFTTDADKIIKMLSDKFAVTTEVRDTSFCRLFVNQNDCRLKIDFINDVAFHDGDFLKIGLVKKCDNLKNILSNKISALQRDAAKDVADIIFICQKFSFNWKEIIEAAIKKDSWVTELEAAALCSEFNTERLQQILWITQPDVTKMDLYLKIIAQEILAGVDNSLSD